MSNGRRNSQKKNSSEVPDVSASSSSLSSASSHPKGYTPGPVNLSHLAANPPAVFDGETIPESYDLVDLGRDTPVRNQDWLGTCWAFGSIVPLESNYLTHLVNNDGKADGSWGNVESLDLSELHVAWYVKNHPDKTKITANKRGEKTLKILNSGYISETIAYLTRLDGPVPEYNLPYVDSIVISDSIGIHPAILTSLDKAKELPSYNAMNIMGYKRTGEWLLPGPEDYPEIYLNENIPLMRLTDVHFASPWPTVGISRIDNFVNTENAHPDMNYIKRLIMEHGAVCIAYYAGDSDATEMNFDTGAYRSKEADKTRNSNHMVAIVGWNDNYPVANFNPATRPEKPGAWLVKNSWGTEWPNVSADVNTQAGLHGGGYFWMSYEQPIDDAAAFIVEDFSGVINVYEYDLMGWCSAYGEGSNKIFAANAFKVKSSGEYLEGISFYTTDNNASVKWSVYGGIKDRPTDSPYPESAVLIDSNTQTFPYAGYHTVKITPNVPLTAGEYFTVVLEITNPSYAYPIAVEHKVEGYSDTAVVHDYESWISRNGTDWTDGVETVISKDNKQLHTPVDACIKAFTVYHDNIRNRTILSDDEKSILELPLKVKPEIDIDVSDENKVRSLPVWKATLEIYASTDTEVKTAQGTNVTFWLENTTEDEEYVLSYADESVSNHQLGMRSLDDELEYDPLFEPGFEPNEYWQTYGNVEHPVYGPFTIKMSADQKIYLDVDELEYVSGDQGLIPAGYYDLVYSIADTNTYGSVHLILMETKIPDEEEDDEQDTKSDDVRPTPTPAPVPGSDDVKPTPTPAPTPSQDIEPEPTPIVRPGSSSGGGCDSGMSIYAMALLAFVPAIRKKKR